MTFFVETLIPHFLRNLRSLNFRAKILIFNVGILIPPLPKKSSFFEFSRQRFVTFKKRRKIMELVINPNWKKIQIKVIKILRHKINSLLDVRIFFFITEKSRLPQIFLFIPGLGEIQFHGNIERCGLRWTSWKRRKVERSHQIFRRILGPRFTVANLRITLERIVLETSLHRNW